VIHVASLSLQGKRASNQDRIFATTDYESGGIVAAVADGLGGMKDGDKAAEIAVGTLGEAASDLLSRMESGFAGASEFAAETYQRANDRIGSWAGTRGRPGSVGTTLVSLIVSNSRYLVVNVGDSRCYAINDMAVRQITKDHTVADALVRQGILAAADYDSSPLRNQLTNSLGPKPAPEPDFFPDAGFGTIDRPSTFLLCSDGFYSKLNTQDFMKLAGPFATLTDVLHALAAEALNRQSSDNISAVVVRVEPRS
jgi:serine/threonine protein phosphatase PrpC